MLIYIGPIDLFCHSSLYLIVHSKLHPGTLNISFKKNPFLLINYFKHSDELSFKQDSHSLLEVSESLRPPFGLKDHIGIGSVSSKNVGIRKNSHVPKEA
jgi:hypothetical protein